MLVVVVAPGIAVAGGENPLPGGVNPPGGGVKPPGGGANPPGGGVEPLPGVVTGGTGDTGELEPGVGMGAPLNTGKLAAGKSQLAAGHAPTPIPITANQLVVTVVSIVPSPLLSISTLAKPSACAVTRTTRLMPATVSVSLISRIPLSGGPPMPPFSGSMVTKARVAPPSVLDLMSNSLTDVKVFRSVTVLTVNVCVRATLAAPARVVVVVALPLTFCVVIKLSGELTLTDELLFSTVVRFAPALVRSVVRVVSTVHGATAKGVPVSVLITLVRVPLSVCPN